MDHFEGTSYGDEIFGALLLVPLAQKYDKKWRRLVWSEHLSAMKFINCTDSHLLGTFAAFVSPVETDKKMLKLYQQAINTIGFNVNSVPYRIAMNHLKNFVK